MLREISGYERTSGKALQYVLDEAGLSRQPDVDFDEFVEVRETCRATFSLCFFKVWILFYSLSVIRAAKDDASFPLFSDLS